MQYLRKYPKSDKIQDVAKHSLETLAIELHSGWLDVKEEFKLDKYAFQPVKKAYNYTIDSVVKSKDINEGMALALGASVIVNFAITKFARTIPGIDSDSLHAYSYWAESLGGSAVFVTNFVYQRRKEGESYRNIRDELLRIGITGATISLGPYKMSRGPMMDWMDDLNVPKDIVPLATQAVLLIPYGLAIDLLGKPMKYLHENRHKINKRIRDMPLEVKNNIRHFNYKRKNSIKS